MTRLEKTIKEVSDLFDFYQEIKKIKKANAHLLGQGGSGSRVENMGQSAALPKKQGGWDVGMKQ